MGEEPIAVGVDLAWGEQNATGLCIVIASRVIDSTALRTDEQIDEFVTSREPLVGRSVGTTG